MLGARTVGEIGFSYRDRVFSAESPSTVPGTVTGVQLGLDRRILESPRQRLDAEVRGFAAGPALGGELSFTRGTASLRYEWALGPASEPDRTLLVTRALYGRGSDSLPLDEAFLPGGGPESPFLCAPTASSRTGSRDPRPWAGRWRCSTRRCAGCCCRAGPCSLGCVAFYDAALSSRGLETTPWQHDVGVGLRFALSGTIVRIDWGHRLTDGANAWTLGVGQAFCDTLRRQAGRSIRFVGSLLSRCICCF